jgi:hypothetical protein
MSWVTYQHVVNKLNFTHEIKFDLASPEALERLEELDPELANGPLRIYNFNKIYENMRAWCLTNGWIEYDQHKFLGKFPNETDFKVDTTRMLLYFCFQDKAKALVFKLRFG